MSGVALLLDLLKKNPNLYSIKFSASSAVAAASAAATIPVSFASNSFIGPHVSHSDAAAISPSVDYYDTIRKFSASLYDDNLNYSPKEYYFEPKPIFSAFQWKQLAMTSVRSFLLFYLPLLEPKMNPEDEDEDFFADSSEEHRVDLVTPFHKSIKQIARETSVVTTRRILERVAVHYAPRRISWKLLKDVSKSAVRKAERSLPTTVYIFRVSRTTLRGHCLGVAASWIIQVGIEVYRMFSRISKSGEQNPAVDTSKQVKLFGKRVSVVTLKCSASLIFASIGAGVGAAIVRPSLGQWIGCAVGDLAGPIVVSVYLDKVLHFEV